MPTRGWREGSCAEHTLCAKNQLEQSLKQPCEMGVISFRRRLGEVKYLHKQVEQEEHKLETPVLLFPLGHIIHGKPKPGEKNTRPKPGKVCGEVSKY